MPTIEFEGKNTEEAIEKACSHLHVASSELKFEILSTGSSGIFGIGGKKAKIRVIIEEKIVKKPAETAAPDREEPAVREEEIENKEVSPRRDYQRKHEKRQEPKRPDRRTAAESREPRRGEGKKGDRRDKRRVRPEDREMPVEITMSENIPVAPTVAGPGESLYDGPDDDIMSASRAALEGILSRMSLEGKVSVSRIQDRIILKIEGENSGLLIGKKGGTLDALQYLINKIVNKSGTEKFRIVVDAEDYRVRRHQALIDLARRMAEKAKRNKRPVTISQLTAHDRRVVHLALQDVPGLKTRSRGEGALKNIIVIPEGRRETEKEMDTPEPLVPTPAVQAEDAYLSAGDNEDDD